MPANTWKSHASADLGVSLIHWQALSGGDFAQSYSANISDTPTVLNPVHGLAPGERIFIKTHSKPPPKHFTTEALGLDWLAETVTVQVPSVLGVSDDIPYLAIAWVSESPRHQVSQPGEEAFGRQLAALHVYECACFGRQDRRSTGSQGLPNNPCESWSEFYASQRLLPLARLAADRGALSGKVISNIEALCKRLDDFVPVDTRPSRLHGDLWAGNRLVDADGHSWVIDPAAHGGHREFDLAMMRLFGGFSDTCFSAYNEVFALEPDWQQRVSLHQLAPLIVHAIKFGSAYVGPTEDALSQYV